MNTQIKYPTLEEIFKQLTTQFPEAQVHMSAKELKKLSRKLSEIFENMQETKYQGYAKLEQPAPCVQLYRWQNANIRDERKYYPADYSSITIYVEKYGEIDIHIVTVWGCKRIELHFVSPFTDAERKQLEINCEGLMTRMKIDKNERANIMADVLSKLISDII